MWNYDNMMGRKRSEDSVCVVCVGMCVYTLIKVNMETWTQNRCHPKFLYFPKDIKLLTMASTQIKDLSVRTIHLSLIILEFTFPSVPSSLSLLFTMKSWRHSSISIDCSEIGWLIGQFPITIPLVKLKFQGCHNPMSSVLINLQLSPGHQSTCAVLSCFNQVDAKQIETVRHNGKEAKNTGGLRLASESHV